MIWSTCSTVDELNHRTKGTLCDALDIRFTEVGPEFLVATMPVDGRTKQPAGLLHGGASAALAETLGSVASLLCLDDAASMPVGIEINANHLRSVTSGFVTGRVTPVRIGKKLHVWTIEIRDAEDELVCVSRLTVMIVERR